MAPSRRRGWEIAHPLGEKLGEPRHVALEDATVGENTHLHVPPTGGSRPEQPVEQHAGHGRAAALARETAEGADEVFS